MRRVFFFVVMAVCVTTAWAQFRGVEWGATPEEVIEQKGEEYNEGDDSLVYRATIMDTEAHVIYGFKDNKLASGMLMLPEGDYDRAYIALMERYGLPVAEEDNMSHWQTETTAVILFQMDPGITISYGDREVLRRQSEQSEEEREKQAEQDASQL